MLIPTAKGTHHRYAMPYQVAIPSNNCLEREAYYVQSLTTQDQFRLNRQVPETIVKGDTAEDLSAIALFGWYEWVMFCDTSATYPDDKMGWF